MTPGSPARALTRLTAAVALAITLLPPLGFVLVQYQGLAHALSADARIQAVLISNMVGHKPGTWHDAPERLLVAVAPVREADRDTRIFDRRDQLLTATRSAFTWPTVARSDEFHDAGRPAGRVEVVASSAIILVETGLVLALSGGLGFLIFVPLRKMPARALKRASESLVRSKLNQSLVDGLSEGMVLTDDQLNVIAANRSAERIPGLAQPIVPGCNLIDCIQGATRESGAPFPPERWPMRRCLDTNIPEGPVVMVLTTADGAKILLSLEAKPIRHGEQDEHRAAVTSIEDITEQKHTADRLILTERAFQSAHDAIVITDSSKRIISINNAYCEISGYDRAQLLGQKPSIQSSGRHEAAFYRAMWESIASTGTWHGEIWNRRCNGEIYPALLSISEVRDGMGQLTHYIGTLFDISERMQAEQQVRHLARHDSLTGLPNRIALRETLGQALAAAQRHGWRVGVFFIDLDRFKLINDSKGHRAGDLVFTEVARRLRSVLRSEDTVGRLAGDEFVVVTPNVDCDAMLFTVAENVLQALSLPFALDAEEFSLTASVGIVVYPNDGGDLDSLLSNADTAMYAAKADGRANFKFFTAAMNEAGRNQLEISHSVKVGLQRKEFVLAYQAQVDCADGSRILGAEALIRWNHPQRACVLPGEFIPVIEGSRLIIELGDWVLDEAMRQSKTWREQGLETCISINVSPLQFQQEHFVAGLRERAARHAFVPGSIRLELTERLMLSDPEATIGKMHQIRELGYLLSLDDFGTGYSSLAYLARFPFDELKIDRSFVSRLSVDPTAQAIVDAVIVLSHALGLQTVAEGVETQAEADILQGLGCDQIQGYLYSRPIPAAEFECCLRASVIAHPTRDCPGEIHPAATPLAG